MREVLFSLLLLFGAINIFVSSVSVARKPQTIKKWTIQMVGYSPMKNDDYVAVSMEAPTGYIVGYEPLANADRVHHMLLYGCTQPYTTSGFWRGESTCGGGGTHILYAWARNAPNLELPKGVGFAIGDSSGESGIKYLVLQVHYAAPFTGNVRDYSGITLKVAAEEPPNLAAVYLLVSGLPIPAGQSAFQNNMSCTYQSKTVLHPFAFRTHTHKMGRLVSAFYKRDGHWTLVGKRNPQWPQLFEEISRPLEMHEGDFIAGSCRFDSSGTKEVTPMGSMGSNEMCNFYMMVYYKASDDNPFPYGAYCNRGNPPHSFDDYPKEGTELLPARPELEHHAHQSAVPFGVVEEAKFTSIGNVKLGQVSGLSFDSSHNLVVFHRGKRVWNQNTFNGENELNDKTPISEDVILISKMQGKNASLVTKTGKGLFYLPHGIFVDSGLDNSIYTTDVGSHTVAKWKLNSDSSLTKVWEAVRLLIEVDKNTYPIECSQESTIALLLAGLPINNWPDFGTIVACKDLEWRLSKADLNVFTVQMIGAENDDIMVLEKTTYQETPFELPPLGDKITNLLRSIAVKNTPQEKMIETLQSAKCRDDFVKLKSDKRYMAQYSFVAPQLLRYVISNPDDLGGFILVYKKWNEQHEHKRRHLDERLEHTMMHTPELLTPPSTLYIKGLINGHEVVAMIDTGAQTTVMHASLAQTLGLMECIDSRMGMPAVQGVGGKTRPLGKIFGIDFQLSAGIIAVSAIILPTDGSMSNHFILGLDVMLCHGCVIDLPNRRLTFSGHHEPILSVEECNTIDRAKHTRPDSSAN